MASSSGVSALYRFGVFELEGRSGELRRNGVKLKLQDQPYQVLLKLLEHAGQIVGREELRSALWSDDTFVDFETGLNTTIRRLRETLGDSAENPTYIETVPKRGYRFIAPVKKQDSASLSAPAAGVAERAVSESSRSRIGIGARLALVFILTGLLAGFSLKHFAAADLPREKVLDFVQLTSDGQAKVGPLLSDGSRIYFSEVLPSGQILAQVPVRGGETSPIPTSIPNPLPVDISPDGTELLVIAGKDRMAKEEERGIELWIVPVAGGSARPVGSVRARSAIWSPDGTSILYSDGHDIYKVDKDGSGQRKFLTVSGYPSSLRWSPDGRRLRFTMTSQVMNISTSLWEVSAQGKNLHEVLPQIRNSFVCCGVWTSQGQDFLFQSLSAGRTDLWEIREERNFLRPAASPVRLTAGPMDFSQPAAGRTPNVVFAVGSLPRAELVKYRSQTQEFEPYLSGISAEGVDSSRDGHWVSYTSFPESTLWRSNSDGGERLQLTFPPMRAFMPHLSPDGKQIAFIGTVDREHWTNYVISVNGGVARQLVPGDEQFADPTWMPDGKTIVYGPWSGGVAHGLYTLDLSTNKISAIPGSEELWSPRVSPDGRYIAAMTRHESKMMLLDQSTGKWEEIASSYTGYPTFSHDGKFLYFQDWESGTLFPTRIMRVRISDRKLENVLDLQTVSRLPIGAFVTWSGLAPDDSILIAQNISAQEIYSLKW